MKNIKAIYLIMICFQFCFANAAVLKGDSLKSSYDLKDPRNPHCECLKYQKLADDEYSKLLGKEIKVNADHKNSNFTDSFNGNNNLHSNDKAVSKKQYSKGKRWNLFNNKKKKNSKRKRTPRLRKDNTSCFHF